MALDLCATAHSELMADMFPTQARKEHIKAALYANIFLAPVRRVLHGASAGAVRAGT